MSYILTMWWIFVGGSSELHSSVYAYTFSSISNCRQVGDKWLNPHHALWYTEPQKPIAYGCMPGDTAYAVQKRRE